MSGRVLAIDVGEARIGLALSDPLGIIAQPLAPVAAVPRRRALEDVVRLCREKGVVQIVVGLPRHQAGHEGTAAALARRFGDDLAAAAALPVHFEDERLSTREAERVLLDADLSRRRRRDTIDGVAASVILQRYLERRAADLPGADTPL